MYEDVRKSHHLTSQVMDFTKDRLPETKWKPIRKEFEPFCPQNIRDDKILFRDWQVDQQSQFFQWVYDRRFVDVDVFRKFQHNGEIIQKLTA